MTTSSLNPQIGMVAAVRNRRATISSVEPSGSDREVLHLVDVAYNDNESPREETLIWELEPEARVIPNKALPRVHGTEPMPSEDLLAIQRACRWTATMPYVDPDGDGPLDRLPISAPFHGAIQAEDYQLVPLLKALRMPRVSLLLADDVGLGKTIEAGLILQELLLRRRIRRILIMTPASLRVQWRDELQEKFSLPFEIVDRDATTRLRRQMGLDANPWRSHSRIITSYHYLKQWDVLEEFRSAARESRHQARLPWDLLIVDEAHHLTPSAFGEESDLCKMLRQVSPMFEHRLFLTATPHNGHTRSYTGLLEMLDPVRFSQTSEFTDKQRERAKSVVIRRLKREINERTDPPRFCTRKEPEALVLDLSSGEKRLSEAFSLFREEVRKVIARGDRQQRTAGNFAVEILGKRLLSCPVAFADSWSRCRAGLEELEETGDREVIAASRSVGEDPSDDRETENRTRAASTAIGSWLKPLAPHVQGPMDAIDRALEELDLPARPIESDDPSIPASDSRYQALRNLIEERLRTNGEWRDDERLVVFTEYKTTLDYILHRLRGEFDDERILYLYGGMSDTATGAELGREDVKAAFNDPTDQVRILVATDAASEGLNLQETARYLLHWDVPWNPARLEQRNGRLDRHGQARDVTVWHFVSDENQDLKFLSHVVKKVDTIREDLGATGELFDEATHRRLVLGDDADVIQRQLDRQVEVAKVRGEIDRDDTATPEDMRENGHDGPGVDLRAIRAELDLSPDALRETFDIAIAGNHPRPRLRPLNGDGRWVIEPTPGWEELIEDTLSLAGTHAIGSRRRAVAFDPDAFLRPVGPRKVFRPRRDTAFLHLAHPLIERGLATLSRLRFPGGAQELHRWSIRRGPLEDGLDALLLLTVEELAINDLRESFHHWIRTLRLPIRDGRLGEPLTHRPPSELLEDTTPARDDETLRNRVADLWIDIEGDVANRLEARRGELTKILAKQLQEDRDAERSREVDRFTSRHGEISALIEQTTMTRLEKEIEDLKEDRKQLNFEFASGELDSLDRSIEHKEAELRRRRSHYEEIRDELQKERTRILDHVIPNRYAMRGEAQVLPVCVEFVFPA